LRITL